MGLAGEMTLENLINSLRKECPLFQELIHNHLLVAFSWGMASETLSSLLKMNFSKKERRSRYNVFPISFIRFSMSFPRLCPFLLFAILRQNRRENLSSSMRTSGGKFYRQLKSNLCLLKCWPFLQHLPLDKRGWIIESAIQQTQSHFYEIPTFIVSNDGVSHFLIALAKSDRLFRVLVCRA